MKQSNAQKAAEAWGTAPDWIQRLAEACDAHGLNRTAAQIALSPALVSLVLRRRHQARYTYAEARVRGALMTPTVACPVLGHISAAQCRAEQEKPFTSANHLAVAVYRACRRNCRYFAAQGEKKGVA